MTAEGTTEATDETSLERIRRRLREVFRCEEAVAVLRRNGEDARHQLRADLALGRQRSAAGSALWSQGHTSEGLRLLTSGFETSWRAVEGHALGTLRATSPELAATLADAQALATALPSAGALPRYDREVTADHTELAERLSRAHTRLDHGVRPRALDERERVRLRGARKAWAAAGVTVALFGLYMALRAPRVMVAQASDVYLQLPVFAAARAVDGLAESYWLLPNTQAGWLDVRVSPRRRFSKIKLLNATNAPYMDRGTRAYRVELYSQDRLVGSINGTFEWQDIPDWRVHELPPVEIDRVRFVVIGWHRNGGGLAELALE